MENKLYIKTHPSVEEKILSFPEDIQPKIRTIRNLIISTAENLEEVMEMEETLKWGEPSYITKKGSTIRISWSEKKPEQYGLYFTCTSSLVDTFKVIYADLFTYEKSRAILFHKNDRIPEKELGDCIAMALEYHKIKYKRLLGR